jgi:hypothetical protein
MKSFIAFAVILAVAFAAPLTDEQKAKAQQHAKKCIAETGADPAAVQKLKEGDYSNNDEKTQCFALCFLKEAGMVDAEGNQNEEVIIEKLSATHDKSKVKAVVAKCKNQTGTPCEKAFNAYKCYRTAAQI